MGGRKWMKGRVYTSPNFTCRAFYELSAELWSLSSKLPFRALLSFAAWFLALWMQHFMAVLHLMSAHCFYMSQAHYKVATLV